MIGSTHSNYMYNKFTLPGEKRENKANLDVTMVCCQMSYHGCSLFIVFLEVFYFLPSKSTIFDLGLAGAVNNS